jgi:hypothetical protein
MVMEILYSGLAPAEIRLNVSEEDLAAVYDIMANYFFAMLPYTDLDKITSFAPEKQAIADFARKYNVPLDHPTSVVNFYRAILGRPKERNTNTRPKLAIAK